MKKILLIGILVCLNLHISAQKIEVINNSGKFGENLITNKNIIGNELIFSDRIYRTYFETESNCLTVQLRGLFMGEKLVKNLGDVILYDLKSKKTRWKFPIDYQNYFINQNGQFIFKSGLKKTYCLDYETGKELWKAKNTLAFTHPKLKIGIGYTPFISNKILFNDINFEGIDLNTGNTIWKRPIRHENGLDDIVMLNDTVAIIISSGLHTVNLKTGFGWDYNAITGDFQLMKRDIRSNLIRDSLNLYFASKEKISCIDLDGNVVWSTQLPENMTSRSIITIMESTLFMINTGSIKLDYAVVKQGKPFLAAFDLKDGCKKFLCTVDEKKGKIIESIVRDERLLILYKDKIAYSSIKDGKLIEVKSFDTKIYGEIIGFIGLNIFNKFDLEYKSIAITDNENYYLYTNKNKVLAINKDLDIVKEFNTDDLYNYYLKYKNLRFLTSKKGSVVINDDNIIVAKIEIEGKAKKIGTKLYFIGENKIVEIDLDEITPVDIKAETEL